MKARVTRYKAIFWDEASGELVEMEGGYTGTRLKMDLSKRAKENDLKLIGVVARSRVMMEIDAPLFINYCKTEEQHEEVM